jgi:hypothetical protein
LGDDILDTAMQGTERIEVVIKIAGFSEILPTTKAPDKVR